MRIIPTFGAFTAGLLIAAAPLLSPASLGAPVFSQDGGGDLPFPPGFFRRIPDGAANSPTLRPIVPGAPSRPGLGLGDDGEGGTTVGRGLDAEAPPNGPPPKPPTHAEMLDRLFDRLKAAADAGEAQGIASRVEALWLQSGSATADLLMSRAVSAANGSRRDVAAALFDKIVELQPDWAEAWNRRATLRFLDGDDAGAMEDIAHVLKLEPRHFGALSGMASILVRHGEAPDALVALRRALSLDPQNVDLKKAVDKLVPEVEGREL